MIKRTLVFSQPAYLSMRRDQMMVTYPDQKESPRTVPIEDIGLVLLENSRITFTHQLITRLLEHKAVVITCDYRHMPAGMIVPMVGHTLQSLRIRKQLEMSVPLKKNLWQQTVQAKIMNQAALLEEWEEDNSTLHYWARRVRSGDPENHEALAAGYYWNHLFFDSLDGFVRSREGDPPNNLLNYGYAVLRAITARALVSSGLFPTLGIHHKSQYNAYCLADDIMEPYRIYVDSIVREIVEMEEPIEELTIGLKKRFWNLPVMDVRMGRRKRPLMIAMNETTSSLYQCIIGKRRKIKYPVYESIPIFQN